MRTDRLAALVVPAGALLLSSPLPAADRVIAEAGELVVSVDRARSCDGPLRLDIEADDPDRFGADLTAVQNLVDVGLQVLTFECGSPDAVEVRGFLRGIAEPVFEASAERDGQWLLEPVVAIESSTVAAPEAARPSAPLTVAGLYLSMPLAEAIEAVESAFGVTPDYDAASGLLTMRSGGCPPHYDGAAGGSMPAAGWQCLTGRFAGQADPRLARLDLVQVIEGSDPDAAERVLVERFGVPETVSAAASTDSAREPGRQLGWGRPLDTAGNGQRHELSARIIGPGAGLTVVALTLVDPATAESDAAPSPATRLTL